MGAAVITGATSPTPGVKTTTASTPTTPIMIFSSKRWVFNASQKDSTKHEESLFACAHFFPPFPAEALPRHQSAQQEVSAALAPRFAVWSECGLSYERHPCSQHDCAASLVCCFLPAHSLHGSDIFCHRGASNHHQVQVHFQSLTSDAFTGLSQRNGQKVVPLAFASS